MQIIRDTREKDGYLFDARTYSDIEVVTGTLTTGDYSVKGLENMVACERKSVSDLIHSISNERARFEKELHRSRSLEAFCVVIEGTWHQVASGQYRSRMTPTAASQTLLAFTARYRCNFLFSGGRQAGEYMVAHFLRHYVEGKRKLLEKVQHAIAS